MRAAVAIVAAALLNAAPALAQNVQGANDSQAIQDCIKTRGANDNKWDSCIGLVANPCLASDKAISTADQVACIARERTVWDDILNETFRRLRDKLDSKQQAKLRDMQRAWIASRDRNCGFYWEYFRGTIASTMGADCMNRETGRQTLFLLGFLLDADAK